MPSWSDGAPKRAILDFVSHVTREGSRAPMAIIAAVKHGLRDARPGRAPYTWTVLTSSEKRGARLREGLRATARIIVLGLVMDAAYQIVALRRFYPGEAVVVAIVLAFVPYLLARGPVARIASWWMHRTAAGREA